MIRTCFSTLACPDWSFDEMVRNGSEGGYHGVEIRLVQRQTDLLQVPDLGPQRLAGCRRLLQSSGFCVAGLASSVAFDSPDPNERRRQVLVGRAYLELAVELGAQFVRVFGDTIRQEVGRDSTVEQVAEGLNQLGDHAESLNCEVVLETHGDFSDSRLVADTFQHVVSPAVGILWDTHHPWRFQDESLAETIARFHGRVRHTHWKDSATPRSRDPQPQATEDAATVNAAATAHALMSGHRHADYVLFGDGEFPAVECLQLLEANGYDGWYCYEWEKMWHPELAGPETALPLFPNTLRQLHRLALSARTCPPSAG